MSDSREPILEAMAMALRPLLPPGAGFMLTIAEGEKDAEGRELDIVSTRSNMERMEAYRILRMVEAGLLRKEIERLAEVET